MSSSSSLFDFLVNAKEYKDFIASGKAVVDFYASWCGKCRQIAPHYKELANQFSARGVKFAKFDTSGTQ